MAGFFGATLLAIRTGLGNPLATGAPSRAAALLSAPFTLARSSLWNFFNATFNSKPLEAMSHAVPCLLLSIGFPFAIASFVLALLEIMLRESATLASTALKSFPSLDSLAWQSPQIIARGQAKTFQDEIKDGKASNENHCL